jgi:hypothetical protein
MPPVDLDPIYEILGRLNRRVAVLGACIIPTASAGFGWIAYKIATDDLGLPKTLSGVIAFVAYLVILGFARHEFDR